MSINRTKSTSLFNNWLYLIVGFIAITSIVYVFSFLINDRIDWTILFFLNPDSYIPFIDELMVLITDYSMFGFGLVFVSWEIAYLVSRHTQRAKENAGKVLKIIGMIIAVITCSAYFWAGYAHPIIFFPLAVFSLGAFKFIANTMTGYSEKKLEQINRLFWITLLATILTELAAEQIIKKVVARSRPLSDAYAAFNSQIRQVPDETVSSGYSYVAAHASIFFAMITPLIWFVKNKYVMIGLILWASIHAFTRVYLAAHFPYCALMGSALGFAMATLVIKIFGVSEVTTERVSDR